MRNANDASLADTRNAETYVGDDLSPTRRRHERRSSRHMYAARTDRARQFPVRYFRIDSQPLFSPCRHTANAAFETAGIPFVLSLSSIVYSHPRPFEHPSRPILLLPSCSSATETRAGPRERKREREINDRDAPRGGEDTERREKPTSKWILIVVLVAPRDRR